jgi:hypothetical protein
MLRPTDPYGREVFADAPLAYLRLDDTQDVIVPDVMDAHMGTHTAGPTVGQSPLISTGRSVAYANSGQTPLTTMGTLGASLLTSSCEFWIKTTATSGPLAAFGVVNTLSDNLIYACYINSNLETYVSGAVEFHLRTTAGTNRLAYTGNVGINDGNAHHVVFVVASTTSIVCYVDGVQRTVTQNGSTALAASNNFGWPLTLGARNNRGNIERRLTGTLDEVAFYTTQLTGARVTAHYNARATVDPVGQYPVRSIWMQPTGDGDKAQWSTYGGSATDWQALSKSLVPGVDTPSPSTGVSINNATAIERVTFGSLAGLLNPDEHVAYLRPWAYLRTNSGGLNFSSMYSTGSRVVTGTGWKAGYKQSPFTYAPAFPTTPVLDNFNRADGAIGSNWSNDPVAGGATPAVIASNQLQAPSGGYAEMWWNAASFTGNIEVFATVAAKATTASAGVYISVGQYPSSTASTWDSYELAFLGDTNMWRIQRKTNDAATTIAGPTAGTLNAGDKFGLAVNNGVLTGYRYDGTSWSAVISATDATHTFENGAYLSFATFDTGSVNRLDDFGGGATPLSAGRLVSGSVGMVDLTATANTTADCSAIMLEVGVSGLEHLVPYGNRLVGSRTGTPFQGTFAQYGSLVFDPWFASDDVATVRKIFRDMRERGLDAVRLFLQFGSMMLNAFAVDEYRWQKVERGFVIADEEGIRVDLTGLVTYVTDDTGFVPTWFDALTEDQRWTVEQVWWQRCARATAGHPSVMSYCVLSEPMTQDSGTSWYSNSGLAFGTYLNKNLSGRTPTQIFAAFLTKQIGDNVDGIRSGDPMKPAAFGALYPDVVPHIGPPATSVHMHYYPRWDEMPNALFIDAAVQNRHVPMIIEEIGAHVGSQLGDPQGWMQMVALMQRLRWANYTAGGPNWKGALDDWDMGQFGVGPNAQMMLWRLSSGIFGRYAKEDDRVNSIRPVSARIGQRFT